MRRIATLVLLLVFACQAAGNSRKVVLIARADSPIATLDSVEVRKLFLGFTVLVNGSPLHAVRNRSDALLDNIFLQQIVAMSESAYARQTLGGVMRQGRVRPLEVTSARGVLEALARDSNAVSFAWLDTVERNPNIRVLRVVWDE